MSGRLFAIIMVCLFVLGMVSCANYYQIKDPNSGTIYYADDIEKAGEGGAIQFKDAITGYEVTLQNSEVKEITEEEFEKKTAKE